MGHHGRTRRIVVIDAPSNLGLPGGLLPEELAPLLRALVRSERCVGFNLTIYDPDLDPDGSCAALLADLLQAAFAQL
jgi:arginase